MRELAVAAALAIQGFVVSAAAGDDAAMPAAVAARLTQDASGARLVFDISRPVPAQAYALAAPDRIVVDLPEVTFELDPSAGRVSDATETALVSAFRFGLLAPGKSRIVIDLARPACPGDVGATPIVEGLPASRLTIELKPCDPAAFAAFKRPPADVGAIVDKSSSDPPVVIVIDPGHGGADSGARGVGGVLEKNLVFDFCRELKRQLEAERQYRIVMTRSADDFVDLDDRVAIARAANASLLVSIHADTLAEAAAVNGSTVYTAADRASDAEAARIAARENAASREPGKAKSGERDPAVAGMLFELQRRETRAYSHIFSRGLIDSLRGAARLNRNPERSAGFVVLKAPEFPSVLVELGYLSNAQDVQALSSVDWRQKAAAAMVKAIDAFFAGPNRVSAETGMALDQRQAPRSNAPGAAH
jgi:N-acetylmuramoyl-L-alanine amidase